LKFFEIIAHQFSIYCNLKNSEEETTKLSTAIVQSPLSIVITNTEGEIEYVNPKFTEITGYTFQEVLGQNPKVLKSGHQSEEFYQQLWNTIKSGQIWIGELKNKKKNGDYYWESASITPIVNEKGHITHFLAVKEDITDKKIILEDLILAKEKAEESDRLKASFLNNISHEIRTPLNGIIGFIELLSDPNLTKEEALSYHEIIKDCGFQLANVVTDTVSMAMIESGQEKLYIKDCKLFQLLNNTGVQFTETRSNKNIDFNFYNQIEPDLLVQIDEVKLKQIIDNLLTNAFKFTSKGHVKLSSFVEKKILHIVVKDTGIGIAAENHKFIFERFAKIETDKMQLFRGTGLGLTLCKAYTEMMGGKIWVKSELKKGSEFHVELPILIKA